VVLAPTVAFRPPTVSIGLPVFDGAQYLRSAVDDFIGQTFSDWELIISDNASTDETGEIGREYADRDRRVRYHRNEFNIGALANANWTIALASGRYFALAAYDDRHSTDFLERLVAALDADPDAVLAYGRCTRIGPADDPLRYDSSRLGWLGAADQFYRGDTDLERPLPPARAARYHAVLASASVDAPMHGLFRLDALRRTGGHEIYGSDRLLVARAALQGRFAFVDAPLFRFRIHEGSTANLDEATRLAREAPAASVHRRRARTLLNYVRVVMQADLAPVARAHALASTVGYAIRSPRRAPARRDPAIRVAAAPMRLAL
jgi:glycosyltransferase involved in cell wall biosynthesis